MRLRGKRLSILKFEVKQMLVGEALSIDVDVLLRGRHDSYPCGDRSTAADV